MHFTSDDVKRLYGKRLFLLNSLPASEGEETEKAQVEEEPPLAETSPVKALDPRRFSQGSAITWKLKANAKLALVLTETEFANRELTTTLKQAVLDAGINVARIGFGIYDPKAEAWNFGDMPLGVAVICGACAGQLSAPLHLADRALFPAPFLAAIQRDPTQLAGLREALQQAKATL